MQKRLLREYYELCDGGVCQDFLTEAEKQQVKNGTMILTGVMQRADAQNGNGRVYPKRTLQREIENYKKMVQENRALGELDHPEDSVVNLRNVSHTVIDIWWEGDDVMGKIKILNTPSGEIAKKLIEDGCPLGISSRAMGSVTEANGITLVEEDLQLICFDLVADPSTNGAWMKRSKGSLEEVKSYPQHSKTEKLNKLLNEIVGD